MSSSNLYFHLTMVRHGETDENVRSIIQGCKDTKLNQTGRFQAQCLAEYADFNPSKFNRIYSSDLSRAYDTCLILLSGSSQETDQLNNYDVKSKIIRDHLLRERSFGQLEGHSLSELIQLARKAGVSIPKFTAQGGESIEDVHQRVITFIEQRLLLEVLPGDHVLLVSHGGVIRQMIGYLTTFDCPSLFDKVLLSRVPPNTSINEFKVFYSNRKIVKVECIRLHDIAHLDSNGRQQALNQQQINAV